MDREAEKEVRKLAEQAAKNFRGEFGEEISGLKNQIVQMQQMLNQVHATAEPLTQPTAVPGQSAELVQQLHSFALKAQQQQQMATQQMQHAIQQAVQLLGQAVKHLQTSQVLSQMNLLISQSEQQLQRTNQYAQQFGQMGQQLLHSQPQSQPLQ
ncbi:hypothetical protein [Alicyclobacillus fastidiosus]|uniref:Uncharacterized protein n=1 Tax=Alicyclobacillus fastidiosus TaxID=392011 RepID=A0ABV5AB34_9BACL|nr:hypothetical protein [Alicyclobacillus fastidiosus]WEH11835.1 hypothetical protein PYS47_11795 [Alicyclobacillus fastidiosus]